MITEQICTYEVCKLAKVKGFPHNGNRKYYEFGGSRLFTPTYKEVWYGDFPIPNTCVAAPTQSLLQRWLREEKGLHITILFDNNEFWWQIKNLANRDSEYGEALGFDTYELALEDALKYSLENLV